MAWLVIGGGVAGVSCAADLAERCPSAQVTLVSASSVLKGITDPVRITDNIEFLEVRERPLQFLSDAYPNVRVLHDCVDSLDLERRRARLRGGSVLAYDAVCIASGAVPALFADHHGVVGVRDTETVEELASRLGRSQRVAVVGNGGIALELVHAVTFTDVVWVVREEFVGSTFFDASASRFLLDAAHRQTARHVAQTEAGARGGPGAGGPDAVAAAEEAGQRVADCSKRAGVQAAQGSGPRAMGNALGPQWTAALRRADRRQEGGEEEEPSGGGGEQPLGRRARRARRRPQAGSAGPDPASTPQGSDGAARRGSLNVLHGCAVRAVRGRGEAEWTPSRGTSPLSAAEEEEGVRTAFEREAASWPLVLLLTDGSAVGCDVAVSATGVVPYAGFLPAGAVDRAADGGVLVDACMRAAGRTDVFAAGDVCTVDPRCITSPHWFQMRLWSQARTMGRLAALHMAGQADALGGGLTLELFSHVTHMFGHKVVLVGRFNAQGLGASEEAVARHRVVAADGRIGRQSRHEARREAMLQAQRGGGEAPAAGSAAAPAAAAAGGGGLEVLVRETPGEEYVKVVVQRGRVVGAILIGETDLEETMENLILNGLDVGPLTAWLLEDAVDVEDYFD